MTSNDQLDQKAGRPGSSDWVRDRLSEVPASSSWTHGRACDELVGWLYRVVQHRSNRLNGTWSARADIAQDAMTAVFHALRTPDSRARIAARNNPAAVLERVAARAVESARHRYQMAGLSGVPPNGRNWHKAYPTRLGGHDDVETYADATAAAMTDAIDHAGRIAIRVSTWSHANLGLRLHTDAIEAIAYVTDRLLAGVSRSSLLRGGHSALAGDPALRHLGIAAEAAHSFACWLLGRQAPASTSPPGVLDLALSNARPDQVTAARCRRTAIDCGLTDQPLPPTPPATAAPQIDDSLGLRVA